MRRARLWYRHMLNYIYIAVGGAFGSLLRYWLGGVIDGKMGALFPYGTMFINISGSFAIGLLAEMTGPDGRIIVQSHVRNGVLVGILGGYTTFSSFSWQTLNLVREGEMARAGAYVLFSVALCLVGVWLGTALARYLNLRSF